MNGPCAAIDVVIIASWLPRMWCIRSPSRPYAARNASYSSLGPAVGEVALHDDGVGPERDHLVDRAVVHHLGVRRLARLDREDRADLFGDADPAALDLAEVDVVGGGERRDEPSRGPGHRRDLGGQQRATATTPSTCSAIRRLRLEAGDPRRVVAPGGRHLGVADRRRDGLVGVGAEGHHDLVGPHREQLRVVDHRVSVNTGAPGVLGDFYVRERRAMRPERRQGPRWRPARCAAAATRRPTR